MKVSPAATAFNETMIYSDMSKRFMNKDVYAEYKAKLEELQDGCSLDEKRKIRQDLFHEYSIYDLQTKMKAIYRELYFVGLILAIMVILIFSGVRVGK
jgi:hypothetical protein